MRAPRIVPLMLALVLACGGILTWPAATTATSAPAAPTVRAVVKPEGPLRSHKVTIRGSRLRGATEVRFGNQLATKVRVISDRRIVVTTPRWKRPGTVSIRVRTPAGWSSRSPRATHRFVAPPTIDLLSRDRGPLNAGKRIAIVGSDLDLHPQVRFGDVPAAAVRIRSSHRIIVAPPSSLPGRTAVTVRTDFGTSAVTPATWYEFLEPEPVSAGTFETQPGVVELSSSDVLSVVRHDETPATVPNAAPAVSWSLALAGTAPGVLTGDEISLVPGTAVYPTGLAGRVISVSQDASGNRTIRVTQSDLEDLFGEASVTFSGPIGDLTGARLVTQTSTTERRSSVPSKVGFGTIKPGAFECENKFGEPVSISGKMTMELTEVNPFFDSNAGAWFTKPYVHAWVSYEADTAIEFTAKEEATCALSELWKNNHKKTFIGPYGVSLSFAPDFTVSVSVAGTVKSSQHSYHMVGFGTRPDGSLREYKAGSSDPVELGVEGSVGIEVFGGIEVQVGWLDRLGAGLSAGLYASADLTASISPPEACGTLEGGLRVDVYAFLSLWVKRWDYEAFELKVPFKTVKGCWGLVPPVQDPPVISTTSLPEGVSGQWYFAELETADDREGSWSAETVPPATTGLPPGIELDGDLLYGVPTKTGTFPIRFVFTDASGESASVVLNVVIASVAVWESRVVTYVNQARASAGCPTLKVDSRLQGTARAHAREMASNAYFSTIGLDGRDPGDRMYDAGYDMSWWGEAIGVYYYSPRDLVDGWLEPGKKTRAILLDCVYRHTGVGLSFTQDGDPYWTQDLAAPNSGSAARTRRLGVVHPRCPTATGPIETTSASCQSAGPGRSSA